MGFRRPSTLALAGLLALAACGDESVTGPGADFRSTPPPGGARGITTLSRNLYLGTNIDPVAEAIATYFATDPTPTEEELAAAVAPAASAAWLTVLRTNFAARAEALADEIARSRPAMVGLQEVTTYSLLSLTNPQLGEVVQFDFLDLLLDALADRGLDYRSAVQSSLTEFQLFAIVPDPTNSFTPGPGLVRFHDSDAILARADVATEDEAWDVYSTLAPLGGGLFILRGWTAATATLGSRTFRFFNTHLETQGPAGGLLNAAQGQELVAIAGGGEGPAVMTGDFNSAANADAPAGSTTPTYGLVLQAGFGDAWVLSGGGSTGGKTCCHAGDLSNAAAALDQRIDFIFLRGFAPTQALGPTTKVEVLGDEAGDRFATTDALGQPTTLWPSDHAGLVASFVAGANPGP
ncbi:MAG TPA: endonuclease/exonuclease/phosphatase family protein [Gemmatimonadales bacterium]|nr:endonuclease/exonuclease/phosphatase family protein [Gemmatimonadales bacterium]